MHILVTGGAGFIGSHIVDRFVDLGHEVAVVDNLSTGRREFVNKKATFYQIDIRDRSGVIDVFSREKPVVLCHHAAQMDVRKSVADPAFDAEVNIIGLLRLMEAGRTHGLSQVIFASSGGTIYGEADVVPTPETYDPKPSSPYGVAKLTSEYYLDYYRQVYGIGYVSLRYGNVYGPRQNPHGEAGVVAIFTKKFLSGQAPIINGDGTQTRDFVYVADVVRANELVLGITDSPVVNIGTGVETDVNTIYRHLSALTKTTVAEKHGPAKKGEQRRSCLESGLAKSRLGWEAATNLTEGLRQTVKYFAHEKS